jgi:hypothetical protein
MTKNNTDWQKQIDRLVKYSEKKGFAVEFSSAQGFVSQVELDTKTISLSTNRSLETVFYVFLHELGHTIQFANRKKYAERFGTVFVGFNQKSLTSRVVQLEEEYDAWQRGYDLAKRLKLKINKRKFEMHKARCILSYAEHLVLNHYNDKQKKLDAKRAQKEKSENT